MIRRTRNELDSTDVVIGFDGTRYECPDIASLDHHLEGLRSLIAGVDPQFPHLVARYLAEVDLLLDRRLWLELTTPATRLPER